MEFKIPEYKVDYEKDKIDIYPKLSESMKAVIDFQKKNSEGAFDTNCSWEELRVNYIEERKYWNEGGPVASKTINEKISTPVGEIPIRIYYPNDNEFNYACFFIHGGGYTVGNNDTHDRIMRSIMEYGDCAVIGIDYSLAPETKFPNQIFECAATINYIRENAEKYGLYADNMAISGDSGGGNFALATNLYLRDVLGSNEFISSLLLFYPSLGAFDSESTRTLGNELDGLRMEDRVYYENCYFPEDMDEENPYYKIMNADLTHGIPDTFLSCGELDPLLDSNVLFTKLLDRYGVETELEIVPGVVHAHVHYGRLMDEAITTLKKSGMFYKKIREKSK